MPAEKSFSGHVGGFTPKRYSEPTSAEYRRSLEEPFAAYPQGIEKKPRSLSERERELRRKAAVYRLSPEERLHYVLSIRDLVKRAGEMKHAALESTSEVQKKRYSQEYQALVRQLRELRDSEYGPDIELSWRAYVEDRMKFRRFENLKDRLAELKNERRRTSLAITKDIEGERFEGGDRSRSEKKKRFLFETAREVLATEPVEEELDPEIMEDLYGENWEEILRRDREQEEATEGKKEFRTLVEIDAEIKQVRTEMGKLWKEKRVRVFYSEAQEEKVRDQLNEGREVVDIPSAEKIQKKIERLEEENPESLFGGVLVGPPGTGKTTNVREYCRRTGRKLVEIDLSRDVTRYLFWGTREIMHDDPATRFEQVKNRVGQLTGDRLVRFLESGIEQYGPAFLGVTEEIGEQIKEMDPALAKQYQDSVKDVLEKRFIDQLASDVYKFGKENGWRAGLVMKALQDGSSICFNEFNKASDLSFIHGLLTAKAAPDSEAGLTEPDRERPGWFYIPDANQWVRLPTTTAEDGTERAVSKIYFTANVGTKYNVQPVLGPLASRATGRVMDVDYPPKKEEVMVLQDLIEKSNRKPILDDESNQKLIWLVGSVFPRIRAFVIDKPGEGIEISFRTIRELANKLVDRKTGEPREDMTVDRAVKEVIIDDYKLYGNKDIPNHILTDLLTHKIITDRRVIQECIDEGYITEQEVASILRPKPEEEGETEAGQDLAQAAK